MNRRAPKPMLLLVGGIVGAMLAMAFDPTSGRRRRKLWRDQTWGLMRRTVKRTGKLMRTSVAMGIGLSRRAWHSATSQPREVNARTLVDRVESEVFRDVDIPPGRVAIDSEHDAIVLRGALDSEGQIDELIRAVARVPGVTRVESLLHLEGTPAPNKIAALHASHDGQVTLEHRGHEPMTGAE